MKITLLNGSTKLLTRDVYLSAIEHYEQVFGYQPSRKFGAQKLPIFNNFVFLDYLDLNRS